MDDKIDVTACAQAIEKALALYDCVMYTALKVGNAESPLMEISGFPIVVKIAKKDDTPARPTEES